MDAGLSLRGTESFAMLPLGEANDLRLRSRWRSPKFAGRSPQHDIDANGFRARWQIAAVASNAQRRYLQQPSLAAEPGAAKGAGWAPSVDSVSVSLEFNASMGASWFTQTSYGTAFWQATAYLRSFRYVTRPTRY